MSLSDRMEAFCQEYLVDLNATAAAIRAGYSEKTARQIGGENLGKSEIADRIAELKAERSRRVEVTADEVLAELKGIVFADTNELVEHRQGACRHCHGEGHRYQFTFAEFERQSLAWENARIQQLDKGDGKDVGPFDPQGGIGFNATRDPNPDCPECYGEGESRPVFKDTRKASPGARALYAGVKVTKDGMEMKLHSKLDAIEKIIKHIGFNGPVQVDHTGTVEQKHTLTLADAVKGIAEALGKHAP